MSKQGKWKIQASLQLDFVVQVNISAEDEDSALDTTKEYLTDVMASEISDLVQRHLRELKNVSNESNTTRLEDVVELENSDVDNLEAIETLVEPEDDEEEEEDEDDDTTGSESSATG